ncbi:MAG: hypothetical protein IJO46_12480, partial [Thermoguttaceae bacterium]|nr:hypothetical protein [Thermoguttaceae bacterium]
QDASNVDANRFDQTAETDETQENNAFNVSNGAPQDVSNVDAARLDQSDETDETQENDAANVSNGAPQDVSNVDANRFDQTAETDETQENNAFNVSNGELQDASNVDAAAANVAFVPEERRLAALLGREPTQAEQEEYYWETVAETPSEDAPAPAPTASLFGTAVRLASAPAIAVGRATLALCGAHRRPILGDDAFAATRPRRRRQPGKVSDMMISTVSGVLIAAVVVFPLMRLAVKEIFTTIAKSAVRKIGSNVAISENAPQSDLLPFISEQLVFPRYEATELQPSGGATLQETGTRFESPAIGDDATDPASTQPTLEPIPNDANAPLEPPRNVLQ